MGKDPAFLFYDGDAARDVSHMNRLERGCYFDFIQAQKKFGPLSLSSVQKILGNDFNTCWPALQMCLTYVNHMYFISWLQESIEKRQKYSESRRQNKKGLKQAKNKEKDLTYVHHMENAIENENVIVIENDFKKGVEKIGTGSEPASLTNFSDEFFSTCFDQIYLDKCRIVYRNIDLDQQVQVFKLKVTGSQNAYKGRTCDELRQAFVYHLQNLKSSPTPLKSRKWTIEELDL